VEVGKDVDVRDQVDVPEIIFSAVAFCRTWEYGG
jgi:hypothetical protein